MSDDQKAIEVLSDGGIVIYPTDTAFGIGCRIDRPDSIDRLLKIRHRARSHAMPVMVSEPEMAFNYWLKPTEIVRRVVQVYWPGALTVIAPCDINKVYEPVRGGGNNIGLRMPDHKQILEIISAVGVPILGPSANIHGKSTPYSREDLDPDLIALVDFVLPGVCTLKNVSTVVDFSVIPFKIIRQGAVNIPESL